ncbi:Uncharacterised protein [Salmonella enterica subsp. enterica serovar Bovismorbificans]|nr:Uncharacterised protein [Salmonella enterica subsp. enterica serovar Bovismorbificans]
MLRILHQYRYPATYKVEWQFIAFNEARFCRWCDSTLAKTQYGAIHHIPGAALAATIQPGQHQYPAAFYTAHIQMMLQKNIVLG